MSIYDWPIWTKEVSTFPWTYDATEMCYLLEGHATITPEDGASIEIREGDLVSFAKGLRCTWEIHVAVRKHYEFK